MAEFATLTDLKAHLNMSSTVNDGELSDMLAATTELVESLVGSFAVESVTEQVPVVGDTVMLSRRPVIGDVTLNEGTVTGFTVDGAAGLVVLGVPRWGHRYVTASYAAGAGVVPASVRLATLIITAHLWETQRGTSPSALALQDPTADFGDTPSGAGFALPNRARELLEPFIRARQVA